MKRSCRRHTQVVDFLIRRMIMGTDAVRARQNALGTPDMLMQGVAIPSERKRAAIRMMQIPVRMRQTRMRSIGILSSEDHLHG